MDIDIHRVARACVHAVSTVLDTYRPRLLDAALTHDHQAVGNARHADNFLSAIDLELHDRYRDLLAQEVGDLVYLSEEGDPEAIGADPDLVILVDPLDTSELAVRGLHGYTHLLAYSRSLATPVAAVVGDFFHEIDLYTATVADDDARATLRTRAGATHRLTINPTPPDGRLLVTNYSMRPTQRFRPLAHQARLLGALSTGFDDLSASAAPRGPTGDRSRIGVDFGAIGLCHIASGATDAFIEFAKGFALWDLLPGKLILEAAGGVVCDLDGSPLPWPADAFTDLYAMSEALTTRQAFIAASTRDLAQALAEAIQS